MKLWIDWIFVREEEGGGGGEHSLEPSPTLSSLKRFSTQGGGDDVVNRFTGTVHSSNIQLEIQCAEGQFWDAAAGKCETPWQKKFFKNMNDDLWWGLMAVLIGLLVILALVCLISASYGGTVYILQLRRSASDSEENPSFVQVGGGGGGGGGGGDEPTMGGVPDVSIGNRSKYGPTLKSTNVLLHRFADKKTK